MDQDMMLDPSANTSTNLDAASDPALENTLPPLQDHALTAAEANTQESSVENPPAETEIRSGMLHLLEEMQQLRRDFDTKIKYDESKERQIIVLHEELQHRENLHFRILRPVLMDLIAIYDDIGKLLEDSRAASDSANTQVTRNLESIQETVEEVLRQNGADSFSGEGATVSPERQRIVKVITTDDPSLDKCVARRLRKGFLYDTRVLRPEWVEVYRYLAARQE